MLFFYGTGLYLGSSSRVVEALLFTCLLITLFAFKKLSIFNTLLFLGFFLLGVIYSKAFYLSAPSGHPVSAFPSTSSFGNLEGMVIGESTPTRNGCFLDVQTKQFNGKQVSENVRIFGKEICKAYPGNIIQVSGPLREAMENLNPGGFSYRAYLKQQGIYRVMYAQDDTLHILQNTKIHPVLEIKQMAVSVKKNILSVYQKTLPPPYFSVLFSIVFGGKTSPLPAPLEDAFRRSGVIHVLVASGAQVALLLLMCIGLVRLFLIFRDNLLVKISLFALIFLVLVFYSFMAGGGPSIWRAVLMGGIFLASLLLDKEYHTLSALSFAGLVLLLQNPYLLYSVSFQLSFSACFGILYLAPVIYHALVKKLSDPLLPDDSRLRLFPGFYRFGCTILAASLSAQLFILPIVAHHFHQLSLVAPLANMFTLPLVALLLPIGCLGAISGFLFFPLGIFINAFNGFLLFMLLVLVSIFSSLPLSVVFIPAPHPYLILAWYGAIILLVEKHTGAAKALAKFWKTIAFALCSTCLLFIWWKVLSPSPYLRVTFLDVGQGDSIFIRTPEGMNLLIDGGGTPDYGEGAGFDPGEQLVIPYLRHIGVYTLHGVILSHPHHDHLEGLISALKTFKTLAVFDSGQQNPETPLYSDFLNLIRKKKIPYYVPREGFQLNLGNVKGVFVYPERSLLEGTHSDLDNNSLVLKLEYGKARFFLGGDIQKEAEQKLVQGSQDLRATVLKVSHHGSKTSSSPEFLSRVLPLVAVISCGKGNPFGHPHHKTVSAFQQMGVSLWRTDLEGAVTVETDGNILRVENMKSRKLKCEMSKLKCQ